MLTKQFKAFHHSNTFALVAYNLFNHNHFFPASQIRMVSLNKFYLGKQISEMFYTELELAQIEIRKYCTIDIPRQAKQTIATLLDLAVNLVMLDIRRDQIMTLTSHIDS
jgi:xanthine dehydrogenase molybdopterin-binding subunit B